MLQRNSPSGRIIYCVCSVLQVAERNWRRWKSRAHRIGQKDSLLCYYLVSPRGSDRDMQDALGLKVSQFVSLMGDAQPDGDEAFLRQSEARDRIRRLVERLNDEE